MNNSNIVCGLLAKVWCIVVLMASIMLTSGCTHNNGDVGPWFGEWKLDAVLADGDSVGEYDSDIFWKFQNHVFEMVRISYDGPVEIFDTHNASWEREDGYLLINFMNWDDNNPKEWAEAGEGRYSPFPETHLQPWSVCRLKVLGVDGGKATLEYVSDNDGITYTYILTKQG